jgi:hypothetical protein
MKTRWAVEQAVEPVDPAAGKSQYHREAGNVRRARRFTARRSTSGIFSGAAVFWRRKRSCACEAPERLAPGFCSWAELISRRADRGWAATSWPDWKNGANMRARRGRRTAFWPRLPRCRARPTGRVQWILGAGFRCRTWLEMGRGAQNLCSRTFSGRDVVEGPWPLFGYAPPGGEACPSTQTSTMPSTRY